MSPPFLQLYVADYLADTMDLTTEQHGAYLLLLMTMWRHDGALPDEPRKLARIARVSPRRWPMIWGEISHFFYVEGDMIRNKRLERERQKAVSISKKRSASGVKGGEAKALKSKETSLASATDLPPCLPQHSQISDNIYPPIVPPRGKDDYSQIVSSWNKVADEFELPRVQAVTDRRASKLRGRIEQVGGEEAFLRAIALVAESKFLTGRGSTHWKCNFDFLLQPSSLQKLIEGSYGTPPLDAYKPVDDDEIERRKARLREMQEQGLVL